jgi:hypothetical protein
MKIETIDLRKRCAESDKICAYMKIGYRAIDDWNELMPVVQKVADDILGLHDGSYCDADTLYEHNFVNLLYKDVAYVRNIVCKTIDWLLKQSITEVHGCLYRLTVENLYNHKELMDALANEQIHHILNDAYVWIEDGGELVKCSHLLMLKMAMVLPQTFHTEDVCAINEKEMITELYKKSGQNVEPKIVFES